MKCRYLHGVKEAENALAAVKEQFGYDMDLIEMTSLKPFDMATIQESLARTHKIILLDESTLSGGVGATVSALVGEQCQYTPPFSIFCFSSPCWLACVLSSLFSVRPSD